MFKNIINKIYETLPVWFQNVAISCYGYVWKKRRFGGIFISELKEYKDAHNIMTF